MEETNTVGGYQLIRQIGSGGMGSVWHAVDSSGKPVALKLLHPSIARDPYARRRLQREATVINHVKSNGVAHVLDLEIDSDQPFVVTELVEGPTLATDVNQNGPWSREDLADLAEWLYKILTELHSSGVLHRDIKPSNIMLSAEGPVLIDFGIAQMTDDERFTSTGLVTGTPGYLPPEVIAGEEPSATTDWWAWAAVLVFCATGRQPFGVGPVDAIVARVSTGKSDLKGVERQVGKCLSSALRPNPDLRVSPEEVVSGLKAHPDEFDSTPFDLPPSEMETGIVDREQYVPTQIIDPYASNQVKPHSAMTQPLQQTAKLPVDSFGGPEGVAMPNQPGYGGAAGQILFQAEGAADPGTQSVEQMPQWHKPFVLKSAKMALVTGTLEAVFLAALVILTTGSLLYALPALMVVLSLFGYIRRRANRKGESRGYVQAGDISGGLAKSPLYFVRSVLSVAGAVVVAVFVAFFGWLGIQWVVERAFTWPNLFQAWSFPKELTPLQLLALWIVLSVAGIAAWWFPSGTMYRFGSRYLHDRVIFHWGVRIAVVLILIAANIAIAIHFDAIDQINEIVVHLMHDYS